MSAEIQKRQRFGAAMLVLGEYYSREISTGVIELYWQALRKYDIEAIETAIHRHLSNPDSGQYMPKIADIVRMIDGTSQDSAARAWSLLEEALQRVGTYRDIVFPDPIIHRVVYDMGGWVSFGQKSVKEWPFVAKEFQERYRAYRGRGETPAYPKVLSGIVNGTNRSGGYELETPEYFGPKEVCLAVEKGGVVSIGFGGVDPAAQRFVARLMNSGGVNHSP